MNAARTAQADQLDAAVAQVHGAVDTMVMDHGFAPGATALTPWMAHLLASIVGNGRTTLRTCSHLRPLPSPRPLFVSAHRRRLVCGPCQDRDARAMQGTAEDETCDVCRQPAPGGMLDHLVVALGPVVVPLGVCAPCVSVAVTADPRVAAR